VVELLVGKTAPITGASRGIALAVAERVATRLIVHRANGRDTRPVAEPPRQRHLATAETGARLSARVPAQR